MADSEPRIEHPNRKKAASKIMRLLVIVLLFVSVALMLIITLGGWAALEGAKALQVVYIALYVVLAWFDRSHTGFTDPALPSDLLGLVSALLVPVQILLIATAMSGFRQAWNVEVEHEPEEPERPRGRPSPAPA